jgi:hypothetical protein
VTADASATGEAAFELDAGRLCLDFTNTVRSRPLSDKVDLIGSYEDLLSWARQATILTPGETAALGDLARQQPRAAGLPASGADLHTINKSIGKAMSRAGLSPSPRGGYEWGWPGVPAGLDRVAWWVARSASELLTSGDLTCVRECAGYDCGRLFMDGTKNRSRRWCDMATCGNRAKGRRHYERRKSIRRGAG